MIAIAMVTAVIIVVSAMVFVAAFIVASMVTVINTVYLDVAFDCSRVLIYNIPCTVSHSN